ncbi:Pkinase-domain-containing protein [Gigaspora margarita]|uniref:Pkinase-domain-containing protein n=1 Tax=Gigaspora margarita TaxID=4874 RepID=A0A8H3XIY5_GIGMA|nr:Pkinase-domain-containing protein [Gigaspora margarita]
MLSVNNQRQPSVATNITPSVGVRRPSDENGSPIYSDSTYSNGRPPSPLASPTFSGYATPSGPLSTLEARSRSSSVSSMHSSGGYQHDDFQPERNMSFSNFQQTNDFDTMLTASEAAYSKRRQSPPDQIATDIDSSSLDYPPSSAATSLTRRDHITGHTHDRSRSTSIDGDIEDSAWPLERVLRWLEDNGFSEYKKIFVENKLFGEQFFALTDVRKSKNIKDVDSRSKLITAIRKLRDSRPKRQSFTEKDSHTLGGSPPHENMQSPISSSINSSYSPTTSNIQNGSTIQSKLKVSTSVPDFRSYSPKGPITSPIINPRTSSIGWDRESNKSLSPNSAIPEHENSIYAGLRVVGGVSISHLPEQSQSFAASHSHNIHNQPVTQQYSMSKSEDKNISQSSKKQIKQSHSRSQSHSSSEYTSYYDPPKKRIIQVTKNMEDFRLAKFTDCENPNSIKDIIFSHLDIDQNEKESHTIHVAEIGQDEIGPAISDDDLVQICMKADDRGNLKLLVQRIQPDQLNSLNWNGSTSPRPKRSPYSTTLQPANGQIRRHTSKEHMSQISTSLPIKPNTIPQPHNQSQYSHSLLSSPYSYNQYPYNKHSKSQPHLPMSQNTVSMNLHEVPEIESSYVRPKHVMSSEPDLTLRKSDIHSDVIFPDSIDEKPLWPKLVDNSSTHPEEEISIWAKAPKPTHSSRASNRTSPVDTSRQFIDKNENVNDAYDGIWAQKPKKSSFKQNDSSTMHVKNSVNIESNLPENAEQNSKEVDKFQNIISQSRESSNRSPQFKKRNPSKLARTVSKRRGVKPEESWIERPSTDDVFEDIEQYFPHHNVDMPIVDAHESTHNSLPSGEPLPRTKPMSAIPEKSGAKISRGKSIRVVVREMRDREHTHRKSVDATTINEGKRLSRKPTTKLWGKRPVERIPPGKKAPCLSGSDENCNEKKPVNWVKGKLIGKGNFGKVYLALNLSSSEMMAVKQIELFQTLSDKSNERQKVQIKSFKDEMEILKDLDHENIVSYIGYEENEETVNIFLEYVNGGSIGTVLRSNGPFKEPVVSSFTRQILQGLQYLHDQNILHRDIKSDNILVDEDGCCKISDFGISKRSDHKLAYDNISNISLQGTIFWMAPEVFTNGYSAKVDIWSLGCVVLEMFTDERPWSSYSDLAAMFKLGSEKQAPPIRNDIEISDDARDFLRQCFTIEPEKRPTAEELLNHPFAKEDPDFNFKDYINIPGNNSNVAVILEDHESTG